MRQQSTSLEQLMRKQDVSEYIPSNTGVVRTTICCVDKL
jgi:hypothetical protein